MSDDKKGAKMGQVIQIDEARIKDHLGEMDTSINRELRRV